MTEESPEESAQPDDWDLESEWASARVEAGHSADPFDYPTHEYEFSPVLLIYIGLFLGPFAPFLFALLLIKRLMTVRGAVIMLSVGVASWLALQGLTWAMTDQWSTFALQFMRSSFNFVAGTAAFVVVRGQTKKSHVQSKGTIFNTVIALTVAIALFLMVPKAWLMVLGR